MLFLAIIFTIIYLLISFFLIMLSIHGPDSFALLGLVYLITSNCLLWFRYFYLFKREIKNKIMLLSRDGILIVLSAIIIGISFEIYNQKSYRDKHINCKVFNVQDDTLFTSKNNPIGIEIEMSIQFPKKDYYSIKPNLHLNPEILKNIRRQFPDSIYQVYNFLYPLDFRIIDKLITPTPISYNQYEEGITYNFKFKLIPKYIWNIHGKYCIGYPASNYWKVSREDFERLIQLEDSIKFELSVQGTSYGNQFWDGETQYTKKSYNFKMFYNSVLEEFTEPCKSELFVFY